MKPAISSLFESRYTAAHHCRLPNKPSRRLNFDLLQSFIGYFRWNLSCGLDLAALILWEDIVCANPPSPMAKSLPIHSFLLESKWTNTPLLSARLAHGKKLFGDGDRRQSLFPRGMISDTIWLERTMIAAIVGNFLFAKCIAQWPCILFSLIWWGVWPTNCCRNFLTRIFACSLIKSFEVLWMAWLHGSTRKQIKETLRSSANIWDARTGSLWRGRFFPR